MKDTANMYAHAYERIWLWERYNVAVAMQATDKEGKIIEQQEILPMRHQSGGEQGFNNKHWDQETGKREGPLQYNEFMLRLSGHALNECSKLPAITAPSAADGMQRAAHELVSNNLASNLLVHQINQRFGKSGGGGKVNNRKGRTHGTGGSGNDKKEAATKARGDGEYRRLMSQLNDQLVRWQSDERIYARIERNLAIMKELTDRIIQLRIEDGHRFMTEHFSQANGLNLGGKFVKFNMESGVPGGPNYDRVDLEKTWDSHAEDVKMAIGKVTNGNVQIKRFKHFEAWVTEYGNPDGRFAEGTGANPSHFRTIEM